MADFDFAEVRHAIKEAARESFTRIRAKHPDEEIYAFALYSDDDALGVSPAANSEAGYERCVEKYRSNPSHMKELARLNLPFVPFEYRWSWGEWEYIPGFAQLFDPAGEAIRKAEPDGEDEDEYDAFKGAVYAVMVLGLKDLDADGFFGTGDERRRITLYCSIYDSYEFAWMEEESARILNPPDVYQAFLEQWIQNTVKAEDLANNRAEPSEIYQAFREVIEANT